MAEMSKRHTILCIQKSHRLVKVITLYNSEYCICNLQQSQHHHQLVLVNTQQAAILLHATAVPVSKKGKLFVCMSDTTLLTAGVPMPQQCNVSNF